MRAMHAANRLAWDEAAERYEGWFEEAVELIRSGGCNLYPVEQDLIGDLRGRCRRAIHLQCAGGGTRCRSGTSGADAVVGVDFSPRMLDLARRLTLATGAPATWVEADVLDVPHELDGTADLLYTGRGAIIWLQDLDAWAAVLRRLLAPGGRLVIFDGHPAEWLFDGDGHGGWIAHGLRLLRRPGGVAGLGTGVHRPAVHPGGRAALEVRPRLDPRRDHHGAAWAPVCASSESPSIRSTGGPATATSARTSAAACPCRSPSWQRAGTRGRRARPRERTGPKHLLKRVAMGRAPRCPRRCR